MVRSKQRILAMTVILGGAIVLSEPGVAIAASAPIECPTGIACLWECSTEIQQTADNECWSALGSPEGCCVVGNDDCDIDLSCPGGYSRSCSSYEDVGGNSCGHYD
jgi:hypothetical protein